MPALRAVRGRPQRRLAAVRGVAVAVARGGVAGKPTRTPDACAPARARAAAHTAVGRIARAYAAPAVDHPRATHHVAGPVDAEHPRRATVAAHAAVGPLVERGLTAVGVRAVAVTEARVAVRETAQPRRTRGRRIGEGASVAAPAAVHRIGGGVAARGACLRTIIERHDVGPAVEHQPRIRAIRGGIGGRGRYGGRFSATRGQQESESKREAHGEVG